MLGEYLTNQRKQKGFTLIEIVLVLAIAGLIFSIVFLAVSGAQRARRDTARKNDIGRMRAAIEQWSGNRNGNIPASQVDINDVVSNYLRQGGTQFADPSEGDYVVTFGTGSPGGTQNITYRHQRVCNASFNGMASGGDRQYAILHRLEQGGVVCVDNR